MSRLFRSSRPDYIETRTQPVASSQQATDCSGLPDRTTLRHRRIEKGYTELLGGLFRSSRPDYIETRGRRERQLRFAQHCSGLPDRTTLRLPHRGRVCRRAERHCSGLPDRTTLRPPKRARACASAWLLFRSSRPDYIETRTALRRYRRTARIVPVFQTGLH